MAEAERERVVKPKRPKDRHEFTWEWDGRPCTAVLLACCNLPMEHDVHDPAFLNEAWSECWHDYVEAGPCEYGSYHKWHEVERVQWSIRYREAEDLNDWVWPAHIYLPPTPDAWDRLSPTEKANRRALLSEIWDTQDEFIRQARTERGLTQRLLAERADMTTSRISGLERGKGSLNGLREPR